jgi:hypothetical protein
MNFSQQPHKYVTLPPTQVNCEPLQLDDELNRGHRIVELHPAENAHNIFFFEFLNFLKFDRSDQTRRFAANFH